MNIPTDSDTLENAWAKAQFFEEGTIGYSQNYWAIDQLGVLTASEPEKAWSVIEKIFESHRENAWVIENLGAGPVETLLRMHGAAILPLVKRYLGLDAGFESVLNHVWRDSLPAEIAQVLNRISSR